MITFTKRLLVKHRQFVTTLKEKYEKWVGNRYDVIAHITNGEWVFEYDDNTYSEHSLWDVFWKSLLSDSGEPLPNNWKETAEEVAAHARSMKNAAEIMKINILDIPEEFMSYMYAYRKRWEEYMFENAEDPYYK